MPHVILDTNILLLLVVGSIDPDLLIKHKRTGRFSPNDYHSLTTFLQPMKTLVVTPHIIAECSNLLRQTSEPLRKQVSENLHLIVEQVVEIHVPAVTAVSHSAYPALGVTDAGILSLLHASLSLLTVDLDLYLAALRRNQVATNFNHLIAAS